jgi:UDP:flavonoid glycosyltransferase YjiC (YdhE family)
MRVLFTAPAGYGHLHPLLPLAAAMLSRGHDVRLASDPVNSAAASRLGLTTVNAGVGAADRRGLTAQRFGIDMSGAPARTMGDLMVPYTFAGICAPAMADDLRRLVDSWTPDLVVHDQLEFAAPLIAAELGVRHVARSFGSTVPEHRLRAAEAVLDPLWSASGRAMPPMGAVFDDVYVDIRPPSLPGHPPVGTHVLPERATPADAVGGELPPLVTEGAGPLVYMTLGTVFADPKLLRAAVDALADLAIRLVVTVGPQGDPDAIGAVRDGVHVTRYVPQPELLPHCDVVVCHGGSGTYLGALANGVPLLCLPQGADQFLNGDAIAAFGAGLTLEEEGATGPAIRDAVEQLLAADSYRAAARTLAGEIAAMPPADVVAGQLEELVAG